MRINSSKKLWLLFAIFLLTFCFGDIISTLIVIKTKPTVEIPEKCVCKLPPECETNPAVRKSPTLKTMFFIKLFIALVTFFLTLFLNAKAMGYVLLTLSLFGLFAVLNNLSIYFFNRAFLVFYPIALATYLLLYYFTSPKWELKKS